MRRFTILLIFSLVFLGVAGAALAQTPEPTATTVPLRTPTPGTPTVVPTVVTTATPVLSLSPTPGERTHLVRDGENLYTIAAQYQVTVVSIAELNGITDYNRVLVGQALRIPAGTSPLAPPQSPTPVSSAVTPAPGSDSEAVGFAYGIQVHLPGQDVDTAVAQVEELGLSWVAQRIDWKTYETARGTIDFDALDEIITPLDAAGLNILLTVAAAPNWARSSTEGNGPATNNADYAAFVGALADHYEGVVDAYEIWRSPNIRPEWSGSAIGATAYVDLLKVAYNAIKTADPAALVITAGLAPTASNDGANAIDDRVFLRGIYAAGAADYSDAIGVQALGWANPPDSTCCQNGRPAISGWDDQRAFFFLDTLNDYRGIMNANNDGGTFLWVTSFGWGSSDGIDGAVPAEIGYVSFTDDEEQAQYIVRAFRQGRDLTYVGPMFLSNLNFCEALDDCYWSILAPDGGPRSAYNALEALEK
jgi:polysaccharide biosynthesis protein PslG